METHAYTRTYVTVRVDPTREGWVEHNDKGFPFRVREITYSGDDKAGLRGWGIKIDGSQAYVDRTSSKKLDDLPRELGDHLRNAYINSTKALLTAAEGII